MIEYLKSIFLLTSLLLLIPHPTYGQSGGDILNHLFIRTGISFFNLDPQLPRDLLTHETHPDDDFIIGPAGMTVLDKVKITTFDISLEYTRESSFLEEFSYLLEYTLRIPLNTSGRHEMQHMNDTRPPEMGSFQYTELSKVKSLNELGIGASYGFKSDKNLRFSIRGLVSVGYWSMRFEKGWLRFSEDQTAIEGAVDGITIHPQLGLNIGVLPAQVGITAGCLSFFASYDEPQFNSETIAGCSLRLDGKIHLKGW